MSSTLAPKILTLKVDAAVVKGQAVKFGSDSKHVTPCSAASDKMIGIAQGAQATVEGLVEVSVAGGGKGKAGASVAAGDQLTSDGSGNLIPTTTAGNRVVGVAHDDAASGDLFDVHVLPGTI